MEGIAILGANSLVGQHLLLALSSTNSSDKPVNIWEYSDTPSFRIGGNNNLNSLNIKTFTGIDALDAAIRGCEIVFNLHELQDFSLIPAEDILEQHNVDLVKTLVEKCAEQGVFKLIQLSSVFLQCSARWPNVNNRECEDYAKFRKEIPFPAYCDSKFKAEQIIQQSADTIQTICARIGPLYGEGDCSSLLCDSILLSEKLSPLPLIGDQNGVLQLTYAGNVAYALLKCAEKLTTDKTLRNEVVIICDHTPVRNIYDLMLKRLYEDCNRSTNNRASTMISQRAISFYLFFPLYYLVSVFGHFLAKVLGINSRLKNIPSPYYLYLALHHWTFFSDFKLRLLFDFVPAFDFETSMERSLDYYQQLTSDKITKFSWMPQ
ncbi:3-beta hydroxysteroid dehydrogenase/isomerase family domain-containing protein [Ditylenchus destructor]|nr:3-beta hydroxysteroid dehydrogenase/isomerase family domain-containing protein [Ditylenchus destructor]